jgi:hypothetical protein
MCGCFDGDIGCGGADESTDAPTRFSIERNRVFLVAKICPCLVVCLEVFQELFKWCQQVVSANCAVKHTEIIPYRKYDDRWRVQPKRLQELSKSVADWNLKKMGTTGRGAGKCHVPRVWTGKIAMSVPWDSAMNLCRMLYSCAKASLNSNIPSGLENTGKSWIMPKVLCASS